MKMKFNKQQFQEAFLLANHFGCKREYAAQYLADRGYANTLDLRYGLIKAGVITNNSDYASYVRAAQKDFWSWAFQDEKAA
jgi:hypothetical protein